MNDVAFADFTTAMKVLSHAQKLELLYMLAEDLRSEESENEPNETTLAAASDIRAQVEAGSAGTKDIDAFFEELDD